MEWIQHPIVTAKVIEKLGIIAKCGRVHIVAATKRILFLVLSVAVTATV